MSALLRVPASQQRAFLLTLPEATIKFSGGDGHKKGAIWTLAGCTGYWAFKKWCNARTWRATVSRIAGIDGKSVKLGQTMGRAAVFVPAAVWIS